MLLRLVFVSLSCLVLLIGASKRDWKTGTVLDATTNRTVRTTGSSTTATTTGTVSPDYGAGSTVNAETTASTTVQRVVTNWTNLMIVGAEFSYTVQDSTNRGSGGGLMGAGVDALFNRKHGCRFVIGEEVKYAQEKTAIYVIDADGKECKTEILRQERVATPEFAGWLDRAVKGDATAQNEVGTSYGKGNGVKQDYGQAVAWFRRAAEQGLAIAEYNLGYMYLMGWGVPQDYSEALPWYRKAAIQGYSSAQVQIGLLYERGRGVSQDYSEAVQWYRKAAEQGDATGQTNLAFQYLNGHGVPQDYSEALRWYRRAADQGNAASQFHLGKLYFDGQGVEQNYVLAHMWVNLSVVRGNGNNQKMVVALRDEIAAKMNPAQVEEAQRLARDWKPSPGK